MSTYRPHFDQYQPGIVTGYMRTDEMNVKDLEAKCRDKLKSEWRRVTVDPKLILQLIEERRILADYIDKGHTGNRKSFHAVRVLDRVLQEIAECKS